MNELIKEKVEYGDSLVNTFREHFIKKDLKGGIKYYNEFFEPRNMIYKSFISNVAQGFNGTFDMEQERFKKYKKYYDKIWKGEDLTDKTIFIFNYVCGYGNYIMYSRYIPILAKIAKKVIIEADFNLIDLYRYNFPYCEIIEASNEEYMGEYDYTFHHDHLLNLQKNLDTFPTPKGYLKTDPKLIEHFAPMFNTDKLKVGIYYEGTRPTKTDFYYNTEQMLPIFENKRCQFYLLNSEIANPRIQNIHKHYNIIALSPFTRNALYTAALMKNLDLVITIDSFTLHLAGALGIKTCLLLHDVPAWKYFNDYDKTPWYKSVKIIRRTSKSTPDNDIQILVKYLDKECEKHYSKKLSK